MITGLLHALLLGATAVSAPRPDAPAIEDPSGHALDGLFAALAAIEDDGRGLVRVMHVGDSSIGLDGLPHALRKRMQDRFGDGGAGFVMLDRESANYEHRAASLTASGWSVCYIAYKCDPSGRYGYGGHVFRGRDGATTRVSTRSRGPHGRRVSHIELWYGGDPKGGTLHARVDGDDWLELDTRSDAPIERWHHFHVEPGAHRFELRHGGVGKPRAYGVVFETDGPGVVWDTISMIGAFTRRLLSFDAEHVAAQVRHRDPALVVFGFGGNDLRRFHMGLDPAVFVQEFRAALRLVRAGDRARACLVVGVIDHVRAGPSPVHPRDTRAMIAAQREAAFAEGCAFFDAVAAMGGPGSIRAWRRADPPLAEPDLQHLSMRGRDVMAEMIFQGLMARFDGFRRRGGGERRP